MLRVSVDQSIRMILSEFAYIEKSLQTNEAVSKRIWVGDHLEQFFDVVSVLDALHAVSVSYLVDQEAEETRVEIFPLLLEFEMFVWQIRLMSAQVDINQFVEPNQLLNYLV